MSAVNRRVEQALANSPEIAALEAEAEAARAGRIQASLRPPATLSVEGGHKETDEDTGFVIGAELEFETERKGKRAARIALAGHEIARAELELARRRNELAARVTTLALACMSAAGNETAARDVAARSSAMLDELRQRPVADAPAFLELKVIEAGVIDFRNTARAFASEREALEAEFGELAGAQYAQVPADAVIPAPDFGFDPDTLARQVEGSPAMLAAAAEQSRAAAEADAARLEGRRDIAWGPFVEREDAGETETVVGLAFSIPLSGAGRNRGNVMAAEARRHAAGARIEQARRHAETGLSSRIRQYELAMEQLADIPDALVADLRGAAELADRQYRLGNISVDLFLEVQREYLGIVQAQNETRLAAWTHALEIRRLTGTVQEATP